MLAQKFRLEQLCSRTSLTMLARCSGVNCSGGNWMGGETIGGGMTGWAGSGVECGIGEGE